MSSVPLLHLVKLICHAIQTPTQHMKQSSCITAVAKSAVSKSKLSFEPWDENELVEDHESPSVCKG